MGDRVLVSERAASGGGDGEREETERDENRSFDDGKKTSGGRKRGPTLRGDPSARAARE